MIDPQLAAIMFLVTFVIGRAISRKAVSHLDANQKVLLVDSGGRRRVIAPLILLVAFGAYYLATRTWPERANTLLLAFVVMALLLVIGAVIDAQQRVRALGMPPSYIRLIGLSQAVQLLGAVILLGALAT